MNTEKISSWQHSHSFGTDVQSKGENRTKWVIAITLFMMVIEIFAGMKFGSMALLADGWHMGTHAAALSITVFAYIFARKNADNPRFTFGTGKVGALGGFASAIGLAIVALLVLGESFSRLAVPINIRFNEAIFVAIMGLIVNLVSAIILRDDHHHIGHDHQQHHDHNLRAAYLHVLADALTSLFAIFALIVAKYLGWVWMDPVMGIVGSLVIAKWSYGLIQDTSAVLLDAEISEKKSQSIRAMLEKQNDDRVSDLHIWRVGPKHLAAIISIVTHAPKDSAYYKSLLSDHTDLAHITVEVHHCDSN